MCQIKLIKNNNNNNNKLNIGNYKKHYSWCVPNFGYLHLQPSLDATNARILLNSFKLKYESWRIVVNLIVLVDFERCLIENMTYTATLEGKFSHNHQFRKQWL